MKHNITRIIVSTALAGTLAVAAPAFARGMGPHGDCGPGMSGMAGMHGDPEAHIEHMVRTLNLSTAQRDAVRAVVDKHRSEMRALRDRLADDHKQMGAVTAQDNLDETKLRALADAHGKDMADMIVMRARMQAEINKVLTPAQREQLQKQRGGFGRRGN